MEQFKNQILIVLTSLLIFISIGCTTEDKEIFTPEKTGGSWICDIESMIEDGYNYTLGLDENENFMAISDKRIIKVDNDGNLVLNSTFTPEGRIRIYDGKIYEFINEADISIFDPSKKILMNVYDSEGVLLSATSLDIAGFMYDVEFESNDVLGLMIWNADQFSMTCKKFHLTDGLLQENLLNTGGSFPNSLSITSDGHYMITNSGFANSFTLLDNDLNVIWAKEYNDIFIQKSKYVEGEGIFAMGGIPFSDYEDVSIVKISLTDGTFLDRIDLDIDPAKRDLAFHLNDEVICLSVVEPESNKNMELMFFDFDFMQQSTLEIEGNISASNIIVNQEEGFSFLYGINTDENSTEFFPESHPRLFTLDKTYEIPTTIIVQ